MTHCNTKILSVMAVAAAAVLVSSSTHAQYVTRYDRAPIHHSYDPAAQAYAQAAFVQAPNIMYRGLYNTYAMVPSIYGCCWTNNIGMEGAVGR